MPPDLDGSVAVVTGAGRGLGRQISLRLGRAGARVVAIDLDEESAAATAGLCAAEGVDASSLQADVSRADEVERAFDRLEATTGGCDILVNNAGIDLTLPAAELDPAEWQRIIAVNLSGPFLTARQVLRRSVAGGRRRHIVNVVSTAAKRAWANASAYHASKWGLLGLSHALHVEGRDLGVDVTAVIAGGMRTPFLLERFPDLDQSTLQEPSAVAEAIHFVVTAPAGTVIPELMVLPVGETSWP